MEKKYITPAISILKVNHESLLDSDSGNGASGAKQYEFTDDSESTDETSWATTTDNGANIWDK